MTRLLRVALRCRHFHKDHSIYVARIKRLTSIYDKIIRDGWHIMKPLRHYPVKVNKADSLGVQVTTYCCGYFITNRMFCGFCTTRQFHLRMMKCKQKIYLGSIKKPKKA